MLDGLDSVDWASLTHAYGEASDVPGLLRSLLSHDQNVRGDAIYELFGNIWHQGTVYPASAAAVPFLYELMRAPEVDDKATIAHLLACIAGGVGYFEVHAVGNFGEPTWRRILAKDGKSLEAELAREATEVNSVRRAASVGLQQLLPYLSNDEAEIRWSVAAALGFYPEHIPWSLPAIDVAMASESEEEIRQALAKSKERLRQRSL